MLDAFVDQAVAALDEGYHFMVIDLFPPGPFDSAGIHGAVWERLGGSYAAPPDKPLAVAAYASGVKAERPITCYVEPTSVGTALTDMPLFLDPDHYVNVPFESTYRGAYAGVPRRWQRVIEGAG